MAVTRPSAPPTSSCVCATVRPPQAAPAAEGAAQDPVVQRRVQPHELPVHRHDPRGTAQAHAASGTRASGVCVLDALQCDVLADVSVEHVLEHDQTGQVLTWPGGPGRPGE